VASLPNMEGTKGFEERAHDEDWRASLDLEATERGTGDPEGVCQDRFVNAASYCYRDRNLPPKTSRTKETSCF